MIVEPKLPSLPDNPPPYHPPKNNNALRASSASTSTSRREIPLPPLPPKSPDVKEIQTVKQIFLSKRYKDISGTYCIDPSLPGQAHEICPKKCKRPLPSTSFRTRHGKVNLNLATSGRWTDLSTKTNVDISTNSGDIHVNLFEVQSPRHIALDVYSKKGDIVLIVPKSFSGVVQMRTKRGSLKFLPAFAEAMRVLKAKDDEALILIGEHNFSSSSLHQDSRAADYCQLTSRFGTVTVGLVGEDVQASEPGFWKRLVQYLGQRRDPESDKNGQLIPRNYHN